MRTNLERTARVAALWWLAASGVACGGAGGPAADHQSAAQQVPTCPNPGSCYEDNDYDGIGAGALVQSCGCGTPGWSYVTGDCNDADSSIHPHRLEVAQNGVDDDCNGQVDEAKPSFYVGGNDNTSSSFSIKMTLSSADEIDEVRTGALYAKVYYRRLEEASSPYQTTAILPAVVQDLGTSVTAEVQVTGLEDLEVYEARVDFYRITGYYIPTGAPLYGRLAPADGCSGSSASSPPCSNSDVYYTITRPVGTDTVVKNARADLVLSALYQFHYFRTHSMGSWDDSLKNHFQLAARDTAWCSEFYATSAEATLVDMNPCKYVSATATPQCDAGETSAGEYSISAMKSWFSAYANSYALFEDDPDFSDIRPGDWLGLNPTADWPDGQHTQMFLAYDAAAGNYWYVEGNGSYDNGWGTIVHTSDVAAHGRCDGTLASGSGWYCPSSASTVCSSGCYYIKSIGKVDNSNMLD